MKLRAVLVVVALSGVSGSATAAPNIAGCPVFPDSSPWNQRVDALPVAADSDALVASIGLSATLHPDFSNAGRYGIPFNIVRRSTPRARIGFEYADESDRVRYPIPRRPKIERGSDRHILMIDRDTCRLYELFGAQRSGSRWRAGSGAVWDLRSNRLRPDGWTSADAAGLPIFPGLARFEEVRRGEITHALRFTAPRTRTSYVFPARHQAGESNDPRLPPMGARLRLKASVNIAAFPPQSRVVLTALRRYGMILADNGSPWYVTGAPSAGWNDDDLRELGRLDGSDFEVVDTAGLVGPTG
jgi:hypothetical protein